MCRLGPHPSPHLPPTPLETLLFLQVWILCWSPWQLCRLLFYIYVLNNRYSSSSNCPWIVRTACLESIPRGIRLHRRVSKWCIGECRKKTYSDMWKGDGACQGWKCLSRPIYISHQCKAAGQPHFKARRLVGLRLRCSLWMWRSGFQLPHKAMVPGGEANIEEILLRTWRGAARQADNTGQNGLTSK